MVELEVTLLNEKAVDGPEDVSDVLVEVNNSDEELTRVVDDVLPIVLEVELEGGTN